MRNGSSRSATDAVAGFDAIVTTRLVYLKRGQISGRNSSGLTSERFYAAFADARYGARSEVADRRARVLRTPVYESPRPCLLVNSELALTMNAALRLEAEPVAEEVPCPTAPVANRLANLLAILRREQQCLAESLENVAAVVEQAAEARPARPRAAE